MSLAIVALFPLALSALFLLPLLAWGIIGDSNTSNEQWIYTLWGYLLFVFSWMLLQRDGILGTKYRYYLDSLGVSRAKQSWCELGLSLYGANVFLFGPLLVFLLVFKHATELLFSIPLGEIIEQVAPATGLICLTSYYTISAVQIRRLPFISLLVLPLVLLPWHDDVSKIQCLVLWCASILIERTIPLPKVVLGSWLKGMYRVFLQADIASPRTEGLRYVALILLVIVLKTMFTGVPLEAKPSVANFVSFCTALLLSSSLFNTQTLYRYYHYYLTSLPLSPFRYQISAISYGVIKALPGLAFIGYLGLFSIQQWVLWGLFYAASIIGILIKPRWFFIFPIAVAVVVFLIRYL